MPQAWVSPTAPNLKQKNQRATLEGVELIWQDPLCQAPFLRRKPDFSTSRMWLPQRQQDEQAAKPTMSSIRCCLMVPEHQPCPSYLEDSCALAPVFNVSLPCVLDGCTHRLACKPPPKNKQTTSSYIVERNRSCTFFQSAEDSWEEKPCAQDLPPFPRSCPSAQDQKSLLQCLRLFLQHA